jgi:two-component system, NtrC family, sensor kinase
MEIMIVEDDLITRRMLAKVVAEMGYSTVEADNGRQAWEKLQQHPVQMVITDWMMPEMDGLELCRRIRSNAAERYTYVIILTARAQKSDLLQVFEAGSDDYIAKPFDVEEFKARLKTGQRVVDLEDRHRRKAKKIESLSERVIQSAAQLEAKNTTLKEALVRLETTQAQIIQQEKMASIGQLAAGVAHEINNPTGFVDSNLKSLQDYFADINHLLNGYQEMVNHLCSDEHLATLPAEIGDQLLQLKAEAKRIDIEFIKDDITDLICDCREGTKRIKKIVVDLKAFSHPGENKFDYTDINKGLESTLNVVNNEIKYKAKVSTDFGDLPLIRCFAQELNQVFMNIFVNAAQAIEKKGEIQVRTRHLDDWARIEISDTGPGIHPDHLSRIFDPFFTTKEVGKGTGLGMHIAYKIIEKHNGHMRVESQLGKGATFIIELPVDEQDAA